MATIEVKNDYMLGRQNENLLYYKCMELEQENKQLKENWTTRTKSYNKVVLKNADLEQENKQLKSILTELEETIKNKIKGFREDKDYFIDEKDMYELNHLIQKLKEKYK